MNEAHFINVHHNTWNELEDAMKHLSVKAKNINDLDKLHHLLFLYQTVCGHLSVARTRYGNTATVEYLNSLVTRAHQTIYITKPNNVKRIARFFLQEFPGMLKAEYKLFMISTGIFIVGFLFSFLFTLYREDYALSFVPAEYVNALRDNNNNQFVSDFNYSVASVAIFTNNIKVGILAFAFGITFGTGTVYVLAQNGMMMGALSALAVNSGMSYTFWSLIVPHGVPELFCIFVCGAAGLIIARSMLFPGIHSRRKSFAMGSKKALLLLIGTIPLFVLAGLTEGYITPLPINPLYKYAISLLWFIVLLIYLSLRKIIRANFSLDKIVVPVTEK